MKTSAAFVSSPLKPNHDHQPGCLFSISRNRQDKNGAGERAVSRRKTRLRPPRHEEARTHLFSFSPAASASLQQQRHKNPDLIISPHLVRGCSTPRLPSIFVVFLSLSKKLQPAELVVLDGLGETAGPTAAARSPMGGEEPCVSLRSRFGPRPDYLNLGGTADTRWSINLTQKHNLAAKTS